MSVMRINLLPVRAAREASAIRRELTAVTAAAGAIVLALYGWYLAAEQAVVSAERQIAALTAEVAEVDKVVKQVDDAKKKAATLERKLAVIEQLKRQKVGPAHMLGDLADILTKQRKVWLTAIEEKQGTMVLRGGAIEQENVSEFQLALENQSQFFQKVTLTLVSAAKEPGMVYFLWSITCQTHYAAG